MNTPELEALRNEVIAMLEKVPDAETLVDIRDPLASADLQPDRPDFLAAVEAGLADIDAGQIFSRQQILEDLENLKFHHANRVFEQGKA